MMYLLDVNALVALGCAHHEFHNRIGEWLRQNQFPPLATCSITELGFVRVLAQAPTYRFTIAQASTLLMRMKRVDFPKFSFIADGHDISQLPVWAHTSKQTTDGHLAALANDNGAILATLDSKIRGAHSIPG